MSGFIGQYDITDGFVASQESAPLLTGADGRTEAEDVRHNMEAVHVNKQVEGLDRAKTTQSFKSSSSSHTCLGAGSSCGLRNLPHNEGLWEDPRPRRTNFRESAWKLLGRSL